MAPKNSNNKKAWVMTPNRYDILCGQGKECNGSEGSQRYRLVIDAFRHRYASSLTRQQKCALTVDIFELLKKTNSRFLKYNEKMEAWEELPFMKARDKIGHALRFANRKEKIEPGVACKRSNTSVRCPGGNEGLPPVSMPVPLACASNAPMPSNPFATKSSGIAAFGIPAQAQTQVDGMNASVFLEQVRHTMSSNPATQGNPEAVKATMKRNQTTMTKPAPSFMPWAENSLAAANSYTDALIDHLPQPQQDNMAMFDKKASPTVSAPLRQMYTAADLEPNPVLPPQTDSRKLPMAAPSAILEAAKQNLFVAYNKRETPSFEMSSKNPKRSNLLTVDVLKAAMQYSRGNGSTDTLIKTPCGKGEDEWSILQESVESIGTIDDCGWDSDDPDSCPLVTAAL